MLPGCVATAGKMGDLEENERLFKACEDGNIVAVKRIVAEGADLRRVRWNLCSYPWYAESPLHAACR